MTISQHVNGDRAYNNDLVFQVFGSLSMDKGRAASSQINAQGIPSFVGEWLLDKVIPGQGHLNTSEINQLNHFINKAFPRKDDKNLIHFQLSEGEVKKIIALMQVRIKLESGGKLSSDPYANIAALGLSNLPIAVEIVRKHEMLLRHGVWGKITLAKTDESQVSVLDFEPFQHSSIDWNIYHHYRRQFQISQWRDLMLCSMGINPEHPKLNTTAKTWILARLLPLVGANFHLMELAPKGTGKSFFYENVSSKVTLVGGGKITPAQLFINGKTKEVGLLARNDVVVLDEVQSLTFDNPDEIVGTLKTYLASNRYNRSGYADITSDCSLVMLANIELDFNLRPRNEDFLIKDLPDFLHETAFLDRFAGIIPGWEIPKFESDMKAHQVGLKTDFFSEVLLSLRRDAGCLAYAKEHTKFINDPTIRDEHAILQSAAGFLKILYPHLELTLEDYRRDCLQPAVQLRQAVRNSLYYLDEEFRAREQHLLVDIQ